MSFVSICVLFIGLYTSIYWVFSHYFRKTDEIVDVFTLLLIVTRVKIEAIAEVDVGMGPDDLVKMDLVTVVVSFFNTLGASEFADWSVKSGRCI